MVKDIPHQLTESSTLYFLCRHRKDSQNLNHNLNDYVAHSPSRCDTSIYLKPAEEMFNAVENVDKLVLASARIFSRLGSVSNRSHEGGMWDTDRKENTDPCEDCNYRWECLYIIIRAEIPRDEKILKFTSPTPWPMVSENECKTFTVGVTHFVSRSSEFWDSLNAGTCSRRTARTASGVPQD